MTRNARSPRLLWMGILALFGVLCSLDAEAGESGDPAADAKPPTSAGAFPSDADIRRILENRIDVEHRSVGIVVGLLTPREQRIISYGHLEKDDPRALDGDTIFEIGSISKVFTSLLLSQMVQRGQMALSDPVAKYLPATVRMPEKDGKQITLVDLATHTSGLQRMPTNITPKDANNPFVDYSAAQLYEFLSGDTLTREPGTQYEYSNLAAGLLGFVIARRAGESYEALVRGRICEPLHMSSTVITLTPDMKRRLAPGHNVVDLRTVDGWDFSPPFEAAGAIRSTANDLLKFLAANIGLKKTPLAPAMRAMTSVRRPTGIPDLQIALAWHIWTAHGKEVIWHNGATGGYRAFIGFDPHRRVGVVALSNTRSNEGADDIGRHLLDDQVPLWTPPKEPDIVPLDPKVADAYPGTYQLAPGASIAVTREGDRWYVKKSGFSSAAGAIGYGKVEIFPQSEREFFVKGVDVHLTFPGEGQSRPGELVVLEGTTETHAKRVD